MKYQNFSSENVNCLVVKFSIYLNRRVFVMEFESATINASSEFESLRFYCILACVRDLICAVIIVHHTVFGLISAHTPISALSSISVVFRLLLRKHFFITLTPLNPTFI